MKVYTYNDKVLTNSANGKWLKAADVTPVDPYNPLGLPPLTIRVRCSSRPDSRTPAYITDVAGQAGVYDLCTDGYGSSQGMSDYDWHSMFEFVKGDLLEILGANSTGVTNMAGMCYDCTSLTSIPLFDTTSVSDVSGMFMSCTNVESGALALYQQMSGQTNPPSSYSACFFECGDNTTTGAAERAQIPSSWGGTGA